MPARSLPRAPGGSAGFGARGEDWRMAPLFCARRGTIHARCRKNGSRFDLISLKGDCGMFRQMAFGITAALGAGAAGMAGMAHAAQPEAAPLTLAQGWDDAMRDKFYFPPQGSRIMPNAWFRA
jgi:hypothetical protein